MEKSMKYVKYVEGGVLVSFDGWSYHHIASLPISECDLKVLYDLMLPTVGLDETKINVLNFLKNVFGSHPWIQRKLYNAYLNEQMAYTERKYKRTQQAKATRAWLEGGQTAHFLQKFGKFGSHHAWFVKRVERITKMTVSDGIDLPEEKDDPINLTEYFSVDKDAGVVCKYCRSRACTTEFCAALLGPVEHQQDDEEYIHPRNERLLRILQLKIRDLRQLRVCKTIAMKIKAACDHVEHRARMGVYQVPPTYVEPQMEEPHHSDEASTIKKGNVVLSEVMPTPPAIAASMDNMMWNKLSSTEMDTSFQYLMDRYTLVKNFSWTTVHPRDKQLFRLDLPNDLLKGIEAGTMPLFLPFKIFRYFRSDIEIKVHLNSNKFQVGQLQVAFQYMENYMEYTHNNNVYGASQLPHSLISAGSSNEVTLYIPFKHINPYMHTVQRANGLQALYLGTLTARVLSKLKVSSTGPTSCYGSVFVRLPNANFTGMRDGTIVEPQMFQAATAMAAMKAVDTIIGDRNCDKPTSGSVPSYLVPTGTHSWSLGSGLVEPLHNLRLTNNTAGVGRSGIDGSETNVAIPCRTFGLYNIIEWSKVDMARNVAGYCLFSSDAHPQLNRELFNKFDEEAALPIYNVPPITVVSSLYQQWRGSLEFRFDIICSQFHTGRLLVAYIPGIYGKSCQVSLNQARNSPHAIFSLQDSNTFTFSVPYISDRPWWYRKYCGGQRRKEETAPSRLVMFVLNPLVTMESVSSSIDIAVYVRAGEDFEVSVPVQPAIGLSYNPFNYIDYTDKARAIDTRYPWRVTFWGGFAKDRCVCYYGNDITGSACMMYDPKPVLGPRDCVYYKCEKLDQSCYMNVGTVESPTAEQVEFIVLYPQGDWVMGIPFPQSKEDDAKLCAIAVVKKMPASEIAKMCMPFVSDTHSETTGNPLFAPQVKAFTARIDSFEYVERQAGEDRYESGTILQPTVSLPTTQFGVLTFGENFSDLKDLLRRYQLYYQKFLTVNRMTQVYGEACVQFPAAPCGLNLDTSDRCCQTWNQLRDGAIPIVCSGYIFFRGSLRYRIICSSENTSMNGAKIWVQHHPDQPANSGYVATLAPSMAWGDKYQNHNYGFYIQPMNVNNIIEIEVPFYQQGMYGLAPRINQVFIRTGNGQADILDYIGLGDIVIGATVGVLDKDTEIGLQVYYSVGDDFSLSCFRGFPAVIFNDNIFDNPKKKATKVQPQMMSGFINAVVGGIVGSSAASSAQQSLTSMVVKGVATEVQDQLKPELTELTMALKETAANVHSEFTSDIQTAAITTALGNMLHILANPGPISVAISVFNLLMTMFTKSIDNLFKVKEILITFFTRYWHKFTGLEPIQDDEPVRVQPEAFEDEWYESAEMRQMFSLIFTAIAALVGYVGSAPNSYFNTMRNTAITASLATNIINFLKQMTDVIGMMFKFCMGVLYPESRLDMLLEEAAPDVVKWFKEVEYLKDARIRTRLTFDRQLMDRVFDAAAYGSILITNNIHKSSPASKVILDLYKDICKIRNDMIERGAHPDVRFECFPLYFCGEAGIGKSFLATEVSTTLLAAINYQSSGTPIYYISPGLKHWSGVQNPAVLVSDDIFQVKGQYQEEELANLFKICSSAVLNPPMAAVEDKEKRLNPLIYLMFGNHDFPDLSSIMTCADAVYRRRKFLIRVDFTDHIKQTYPGILDAGLLPREEMGPNFNHLCFSISTNPKIAGSPYGPSMTYVQLMAILQDNFRVHYQRERDNFAMRMRNMYRLDPNFRNLDLFEEIPAIAEQVSMREQKRIFDERIREEMADLNDPFREEEPYVQRLMQRVKQAWNYRYQNFSDNEEAPIPLGDIPMDENINMNESTWLTRYVDDEAKDDAWLDENILDEISEARYRRHGCIFDFGSNLSKDSTDFNFAKNVVTPEEPGSSNYITLTPMSAFVKFCVLNEISANFVEINIKEDMINNLHPSEIVSFSYFSNFLMAGIVSVAGVIPSPKLGPYITARFFWSSRMDVSPMFEKLINLSDELYSASYMVDNFEDIQAMLRRYLQNAYSFDTNKLLNLCTSEQVLENYLKKLTNKYDVLLLTLMTVLTIDPGLRKVIKTPEDAIEILTNKDKPENRQLAYKLIHTNLKFIKAIYCNTNTSCKCLRHYNMFLKDMSNVWYDPVKDTFTYRNYIGLKEKFPRCTHTGVLSNGVFRMFFGMYYNHVHRNDIRIGATYEYSFVGNEFKAKKAECLTYFDKFKGNVKHYWHTKVGPVLGSTLTWILEWIPTILVYLAYMATVIGIVLACMKVGEVVSNVISGDPPDTTFTPQGQNYFSFDKSQPQAKPSPQPHAKVFTKQSAGKVNSVLHNKIVNNTVILHVQFVDGGKRCIRSGRCLMISGRKMLVLRHYLEEFTDVYKKFPDITFTLYYQVGGRSTNSVIYPEDLLKAICWAEVAGNYMKSNFGVVELPKYIPMFKNILPCFVTRAMHKNLTKIADFVCAGGENKFDLIVEKRKNYHIESSDITTEVIMDIVYTYKNQAKGLCGSLLVCNTINSGSGGIYAMHVAGSGSTGEGVAEPLYREMFEEALAVMKPEPIVVDMPLQDLEESDIKLDTNLFMYGCVPPNFAHRESGKTKIVPSKIQGLVYPVCTEPNPLQPNDPRQPEGSHPLRDGCNKHGSGAVIPFKPSYLDKAVDHLTHRYNQIVKPVRLVVEPLTMQDVCCGNSNIPHFESLNWKSSEGFPLRALRPASAHDKRWLFDLEETKDGYKLNGFHKLLTQQLQYRDHCYENNLKPPTIYEDCLKDCRLPPEKCKIPGKTRIFSAAPIGCTLDVRKYMGDFCAAFKQSRIVNSCGIGINADSMEWTTLVTYLYEVGNKIITLDYSNFGPCLMSQIVNGSIEVIINWHKHHNVSEDHLNRVRWLLDCDLINPVHLAHRLVYQTLNGIASGSPITGELNSVSNLLYIYCIWQEIMQAKAPEYADPYYFDMYCRIVVYGDDLIMSVHDDVIAYFNAFTIKEFFLPHGITVTPAQKDSEMRPFGYITDASFLKRGFMQHPTRMYMWLAPIELNSVQECLNWIKTCEDYDDATLQNCEASLNLAYGHGPNYYTAHGVKIYDALSRVGLTINVKSWYLRDNEIFGATDWDAKNKLQKILYPWVLSMDKD